jgi:beta-glucosidase
MRLLTFTLVALGATHLGAQQYPFQNTSLSFEERAADLVSRMTLEERCRR